MQNPLAKTVVTALRGSVNPEIPFDTCSTIGQVPDGAMFELSEFTQDLVQGVEFSKADIDEGEQGGGFTRLRHQVVARHGIQAWLFASAELGQKVQQNLKDIGAWVVAEPSRGGLVLLVTKHEATPVRDTLHNNAMHAAEAALAQGDHRKALTYAKMAWLYAVRPTPVEVGLLSACHRLVGDEARAEFYLRTARNTWGLPFYEQAKTEMEKFFATRRSWAGTPKLPYLVPQPRVVTYASERPSRAFAVHKLKQLKQLRWGKWGGAFLNNKAGTSVEPVDLPGGTTADPLPYRKKGGPD